jgi:hypothetical protein
MMDLLNRQLEQPKKNLRKPIISGKRQPLLLHLAIAAVGCIVLFLLTGSMRKHAEDLKVHFSSGSWEVTTDEAAVETSLRAEYGDRRKWSIHYVGGTSNSFPLAGQYRQETFTQIGQSTSDDDEVLNLRFGFLPEAYGDLLSDLLHAREQTTGYVDADTIRKLADILGSKKYKLSNPSPELFKKSQRALSRLPNTEPLMRALASYRDFSATTAYFPDFQVFTQPPYDNDDLMAVSTRSIEDKKTGKCIGQISQIEGKEPSIPSNMERHPRVLKVQLQRLWLSDELLDNSASLRGEISEKYFGVNGSLKDIPSSVWVLMADDLHIDPISQSDSTTINNWRSSGLCCQVTCAGVTVTLSPTTITPLDAQARAWSGIVAGSSPTAFAVISRHRVAP